MWKAAECRGITYLRTLLSSAYVPSAHETFRINPPVVGWLNISNELAISIRTRPDPPIP